MLALVVLAPLIFMMMPEHWFSRMESIRNYEEDGSAMGRIEAWIMAWNLALDRPIVGGGFNAFMPSVFAVYAPEFNPRAAHSIWFQMLGEHGFVGLGLYVLVLALTWQQASRVMRSAWAHPEWRWAYDLGSMIQVSLVGFMVGGTFLSLPYWDLPYHIGAIMTMVLHLMKEQGLIRSMLGVPVQRLKVGRPQPAPAAAGRSALVRDARR
jgi:putative inorganic carbon (hco3(-)) transporter